MAPKKCLLAALAFGALLSGNALTPAHAQSGPTAAYLYDSRGNVSAIGLPGGRTRSLQWDALGRNTAQSGSGAAVGLAYNGQDQLIGVLDPKGLGTSYTRNGYGEATSQSSPDTGGTSYSFDANGNLRQRINAAGQVESYTYDAADRPLTKTLAHPVSGTITYSFAYGTSGASAGRVIQVAGPGISLGYGYNLLGQVTASTQTVNGGPALSAGFSYSAAGVLTSVTYPSGRVATFSLDGAGRVGSVTVGGSTLLSGMAYSPLGFVAGWTFSNGQNVSRSFDSNGRLTGVTLPTGQRTYSYDADDRIVGITDPVLGNAAYGYDNQDRLTSANTAIGQWGYWYDANGNRIQQTIDGSGYALSVDNGSNRTLQGSAPVARDSLYSADGQTVSITGGAPQASCGGMVTLGYAASGQLVTSSVLSAVYGPSGLRLQKTAATCAGGGTTNFVYDPAGHLIGEYDATGGLIQETVWVGDIPVAVFKPNGAAVIPYYIYSDNLNTPRAITNTAGQTVWRWDGEPFGATPAAENPSNLGQFSYGLRFPGQYFDAETGYHQNRWREYDPKMGRYVQSDPIGLLGGLNTYLYADGNPLGASDTHGLATGLGTPLLVVDAASFTFNAATGNYVAAAFDGAALVIDAIPGVPEGAGVTVRAVRASGVAGKAIRYAVGRYDALKSCVQGLGTGLEVHHVGMGALMKKLVPGYEYEKAAAIAIPKAGHTANIPGVGRVSNSMLNPRTGREFDKARDVLARDVNELRRVYPDIPNSTLQRLIEMNKADYPGAFLK